MSSSRLSSLISKQYETSFISTQHQITTTTHQISTITPKTTTITSSSQIPTTKQPVLNNPPDVTNPIELIFVGSGKFISYRVPRETFTDKEDGDTRNLTLVCFTGDENTLSVPWIDFNSTTQTLNAFPLSYDYGKQVGPQLVHLRAYDSAGSFNTTQLQIVITAPLVTFSYLVSMKILIPFDSFISSKILRFELASRMHEYYEEESVNSTLYFHSVRNGSTILSFNNLTLATLDACDKQAIENNVNVVKSPITNKAQESFEDFLSPQFPVVDMNVQFLRGCLTTSAAPFTGVVDDGYWDYVIPIIVLSLLLLIVILIVWIVYRRQRNRQTFFVGSRRYEKEQPALFPDEIELRAPPKKRLYRDNVVVQAAYHGPYDNTSLDSPDFGGGREGTSKTPASINSDEDSSSYSDFKTPSDSPPEYIIPPPYIHPFNIEDEGSEI